MKVTFKLRAQKIQIIYIYTAKKEKMSSREEMIFLIADYIVFDSTISFGPSGKTFCHTLGFTSSVSTIM